MKNLSRKGATADDTLIGNGRIVVSIVVRPGHYGVHVAWLERAIEVDRAAGTVTVADAVDMDAPPSFSEYYNSSGWDEARRWPVWGRIAAGNGPTRQEAMASLLGLLEAWLGYRPVVTGVVYACPCDGCRRRAPGSS